MKIVTREDAPVLETVKGRRGEILMAGEKCMMINKWKTQYEPIQNALKCALMNTDFVSVYVYWRLRRGAGAAPGHHRLKIMRARL